MRVNRKLILSSIILLLIVCLTWYTRNINVNREFFSEIKDSSVITATDWTIIGKRPVGFYRFRPVYDYSIEFNSIDEVDRYQYICFIDSTVYVLSLKDQYWKWKTYSIEDKFILNAKVGLPYYVEDNGCGIRTLEQVYVVGGERIMLFRSEWDSLCLPLVHVDGGTCPSKLLFSNYVAISDKRGIVGKAYYSVYKHAINIECIVGDSIFREKILQICNLAPR